jgi:hypothetical protein
MTTTDRRRYAVAETMHLATTEKTLWANLRIEIKPFDVFSPNKLRILGTGESVWRGEHIPFLIIGSLNGKSRRGRLLKLHVRWFSLDFAWVCLLRRFARRADWRAILQRFAVRPISVITLCRVVDVGR